MSHIKQLDYFLLRKVSKQLLVAIALRSVREPIAQSWISAMSYISNQTSLKHFGIQGNVCKSIYQGT
jgi:hypothetical protein